MEEYIKILEDIQKELHWHIFQCKRGAICDIMHMKIDALSRLTTIKKMLDIVFHEIESNIHDPK